MSSCVCYGMGRSNCPIHAVVDAVSRGSYSALPKWEYLRLPEMHMSEKRWEQAGNEGWELVAASGHVLYFKRQKVDVE